MWCEETETKGTKIVPQLSPSLLYKNKMILKFSSTVIPSEPMFSRKGHQTGIVGYRKSCQTLQI